MLATDPLSLVFLACIVFSGAFLVIASVSGMGHGLHLGGHALHIGAHAGAPHAATVHHVHLQSHVAHTAHTAHTATAHGGADTSSSGASGAASAHVSSLSALKDALLGSLSPYSILIFILIFGLVGYLLHTATNLGDVLTVVVALLAADGAAISTGLLLTRIFVQGSGQELSRESSRLEGRLGEVSMAIRAGGIGEMLFPGAGGGRQSIGARSVDGEAIPAGTEVVILSMRDGIASVQPWDRFMAGVRAGTAPELQPIDLPSA